MMVLHSFHQHAQVLRFGLALRLRAIAARSRGLLLAERENQVFGLIGRDLAVSQHFQNLPAMFVHEFLLCGNYFRSSNAWMACCALISPRCRRSRISAREGDGFVSTNSRLPAMRLSRALMVG